MTYAVAWDDEHGERRVRNFDRRAEARKLAQSLVQYDDVELHKLVGGGTVEVECYENGELSCVLDDFG